MATDPERLKSIFLDALDAPPAERQALLDKACAGDQELRQRIDAMLRANDRTDKLFDQPAAKLLTEGPAVPSPSQLVGEKVGMIVAGRYQLQKLLGEGGMGSVWQAEQLHPVKRTVAIKLIKAGLDTKEVLHRFDAERQALAIMDHPHIAKVLDGGATDTGRPFFVMEYVPGQAVMEYCDTHRMDVDSRLALFVQICQAVQHAHQKGVIHRDIKPTNILVTEVDGKAVPKVIDFGLAKAVREPLSESTLLTSPGVIMGTLQYMSPEQAELNNTDIDTRVDVYALGVVLYELLTGTTPLEQQQFKKAAWLEMLRMIKEVDPPLPSNRLSSSVSLPSLAAQRNLEPVRLAKLVRGDLDWIVMKALDKDRAHRYDSANELGSDVTRYLSGDPVVAHPASSWYRVRKLLRRYRYQAIAAGLVLSALVVAVVGTTLGLLEARHHEELALKERDAKEKARAAEAEQRHIAELRSARLSKGVEILGSVFTSLDPNSVETSGDKLGVTLGKQLDKAARELQGDAVGDPLVVAGLQEILSSSLLGLGQYPKAIEVLKLAIATRERILGANHPDTLFLRAKLATLLLATKEYGEAIKLYETTVPALVNEWGDNDPRCLRMKATYASTLCEARRFAEAIPQLESIRAEQQRQQASETQEGMIVSNMLAEAFLKTGKPDKAKAILEQILPVAETKLGKLHPDTLIFRTNLAMSYEAEGDFIRCLPLLKESMDALEKKLGDDHPTALAARYDYLLNQRKAGSRQNVAEFQQVLKKFEDKLGKDDPATLRMRSLLGSAYVRDGKPQLGITILEELLEKQRRILGEEHPDLVSVRSALALGYTTDRRFALAVPLREANVAYHEKHPDSNPIEVITERFSLGNAYRETGRADRAVRVIEPTLADAETILGKEHPTTLICRGNLAVAYLDTNQVAKALPLLKYNLELSEKKLGAAQRDTIIFRVNYGSALRELKLYQESLAVLDLAVKHARKTIGPSNPMTFTIIHEWCDVLGLLKQWDQAITERQAMVDFERTKPNNDSKLAAALTRLGMTVLQAGKPAQAESILKESYTIQKKLEPDLWTTRQTESLLGGSLADQKKYNDALPLLVSGYQGLKERMAKIPKRRLVYVTEALDRLIQCCKDMGKPEEAQKWEKER